MHPFATSTFSSPFIVRTMSNVMPGKQNVHAHKCIISTQIQSMLPYTRSGVLHRNVHTPIRGPLVLPIRHSSQRE